MVYLGFYFGRGGGGSKYFCKSGGYLHGEVTRLLGGFGGMLPSEKFYKWCVLENILLKFCKKVCKNTHFLYKNNRYCITVHTIFRGIEAYYPDFLSIVQFGVFWSTFSVIFLLKGQTMSVLLWV